MFDRAAARATDALLLQAGGTISCYRLVKLLFMLDWGHALRFGAPFTGLSWSLRHRMPFSGEVFHHLCESDAYVVLAGNGEGFDVAVGDRADNPKPNTEMDELLGLISEKVRGLDNEDFAAFIGSLYPVFCAEGRDVQFDLGFLAGEYRRSRRR